MNLLLATEFPLHQIHVLQYAHINSPDLTRVMAAQEAIHIIKRCQIIVPGFVPVRDIQPLIGPHIHQRQPTLWKLTSLHRLRAD